MSIKYENGRRYNLALALRDAGTIRDTKPGSSLNFNLHKLFPEPPVPDIVLLAARSMYKILVTNKIGADAVVGIPRSGEPFAQALALVSGLRLAAFEVWHDCKKLRITSLKGHFPLIHRAIVVDDFIVKGDWKRQAIEMLRRESIGVAHVIVLIDCEQGGREELARLGCKLHSVFTAAELKGLHHEQMAIHHLPLKGIVPKPRNGR